MASEILRWFAPAQREPPAARHKMAPRTAWPWLPTLEHQHLAAHPYCAQCGGVKYTGSMRAAPLGGLVNQASRLRDLLRAQGRKVTEAQFRLIVKRLEALEADDTFLHSRRTQERLLLESFSTYTRIDPETLASYLRSG